MIRLKWLVITLVIAFLFTSPAKAQELPTVNSILKQLMCPAGMTMTLAECQVPEHREPVIALIEDKLAEGQSKEQIIQFFVAQYGERVLASPPKRGFNLVAWVLPFVAILAGGGVIYFAVKEWVGRSKLDQTRVMTETEEGEEEYRYRLERELKAFEERGFR